jgi:hypothetical protein
MREWTQRGIKPVRGKQWYPTVWVDIMTSPRLAGLREWQGEKYPAQWPAILDVDTHERLAKMFADPARRKHIVRSQAHLLSVIAVCPKCGRGLHYRNYEGKSSWRKRSDAYACVAGPYGCGRTAIKAGLLEEYVTGAVLDALESPRVQEAMRDGELDEHAPRRAVLLAGIQRNQETRADARRDLADGVIDRADWLDIRQRTEDNIAKARREYDRLAGSATVMSDIPAASQVSRSSGQAVSSASWLSSTVPAARVSSRWLAKASSTASTSWVSAGLLPSVSSARVARPAVSTPSLLVAVSRRNTCRAAACWAGVKAS